MKKYIPISNHDSDVDLSEPWEGCDLSKAVYLASEVDARIAELERKKRLLWDRLQVVDEQLTEQLPHWRGTKSHELIVDLLTECRTS